MATLKEILAAKNAAGGASAAPQEGAPIAPTALPAPPPAADLGAAPAAGLGLPVHDTQQVPETDADWMDYLQMGAQGVAGGWSDEIAADMATSGRSSEDRQHVWREAQKREKALEDRTGAGGIAANMVGGLARDAGLTAITGGAWASPPAQAAMGAIEGLGYSTHENPLLQGADAALGGLASYVLPALGAEAVRLGGKAFTKSGDVVGTLAQKLGLYDGGGLKGIAERQAALSLGGPKKEVVDLTRRGEIGGIGRELLDNGDLSVFGGPMKTNANISDRVEGVGQELGGFDQAFDIQSPQGLRPSANDFSPLDPKLAQEPISFSNKTAGQTSMDPASASRGVGTSYDSAPSPVRVDEYSPEMGMDPSSVKTNLGYDDQPGPINFSKTFDESDPFAPKVHQSGIDPTFFDGELAKYTDDVVDPLKMSGSRRFEPNVDGNFTSIERLPQQSVEPFSLSPAKAEWEPDDLGRLGSPSESLSVPMQPREFPEMKKMWGSGVDMSGTIGKVRSMHDEASRIAPMGAAQSKLAEQLERLKVQGGDGPVSFVEARKTRSMYDRIGNPGVDPDKSLPDAALGEIRSALNQDIDSAARKVATPEQFDELQKVEAQYGRLRTAQDMSTKGLEGTVESGARIPGKFDGFFSREVTGRARPALAVSADGIRKAMESLAQKDMSRFGKYASVLARSEAPEVDHFLLSQEYPEYAEAMESALAGDEPDAGR